MEATSSSFLPKSPQVLMKLSSVASSEKLNPQTKIKTLSFFSTFPLKKLKAYAEKLTPKNPFMASKERKLSRFFKSMDDFVCNFIDLPLRPSIDPKHVLSGNFAPVDELPPTACEVLEGSLPSCLDGAYIRNGPNPQFTPTGPYHLFDGDGMLHMIRISQNKATFCSRYVKTYKFMVENKIGHPTFPSVFSSFNGLAASMMRCLLIAARVLTGEFNPVSNGFGSANTSLALIGGRLFALGESDLPYEIKVTADGDIITLGRHNFFSDEPILSMTAHPRIDPETGEAFALRYQVIPPFLTLFRTDANGKKQPDVPIFSMKSASLIHDLVVTKNYVVFPDTQIVMDLMEITKGRPPARVDSAKVPRLGIIPRCAKDESELLWIEAPGFNMVHCFNAREEDDGETITMVVSNLSSVEQALEMVDLAMPRMEKISVNVKDKTLQRHPLSDKVLDMGVINPAYTGKKNK